MAGSGKSEISQSINGRGILLQIVLGRPVIKSIHEEVKTKTEVEIRGLTAVTRRGV